MAKGKKERTVQQREHTVKFPTFDQVAVMSCEDAATFIEQEIYTVALFMEQLENARKVYGNGHHAAQHLATAARNMVTDRWNVITERKRLGRAAMEHLYVKNPELKKL